MDSNMQVLAAEAHKPNLTNKSSPPVVAHQVPNPSLHFFRDPHPTTPSPLSLCLSTNPAPSALQTTKTASFCSFLLQIPPPLQIVLHFVAALVYYTFDQSSCWTSSSKMSAAIFNAPVGVSGYAGLKVNLWKLFPVNDSIGWAKKTVSNGSRALCMKVWNPINNKKLETLSYLPPLSDDSIAKEIDYMLKKGWIPCLEFDEVGYVYRENSQMPGYYDGRYWTLWELPMFGCTDPSLGTT